MKESAIRVTEQLLYCIWRSQPNISARSSTFRVLGGKFPQSKSVHVQTRTVASTTQLRSWLVRLMKKIHVQIAEGNYEGREMLLFAAQPFWQHDHKGIFPRTRLLALRALNVR